MTEVQILGRPVYAHLNLLMKKLTNISYQPSNLHKESGFSRQQRDCKDTQIVIDYFEQSSPLEGDS